MKAIILACALLTGAAAFGLPEQTASAAEAKNVDAAKKARCEREATLQLYVGKQKSRYIRQCLASKEESPAPRVTPLGDGNPPSTSTGSTAPSNAPVAPSAPVTGSSGTSTTGSSGTSTSGSSGR